MTRLTMTLAALLLASCIGTSPEEREKQALGPYEDGDEFHRPGQPCLTCHREGFSPGEEEFMAAGTVYRFPTDATGLAGVEVTIVDAEGRSATAVSNRVGNFIFERGDSGEGSEYQGAVSVPYDLAYPLRIRVRRDGIETEMESLVWRQGACASCHALDGPHESAEPRVYLEEAMP